MESDERKTGVRWTGRPAWSEYVFLWFFSLVFGVRAALAIWIGEWGTATIHIVGPVLFVALAVFFRQTTRYTLTHDAVYKTKGITWTSESRIPLAEVTAISIRQGPLDRLFGIGTVLLHLKDGANERLAGLKDPEVIQRKLEALLIPAKHI